MNGLYCNVYCNVITVLYWLSSSALCSVIVGVQQLAEHITGTCYDILHVMFSVVCTSVYMVVYVLHTWLLPCRS